MLQELRIREHTHAYGYDFVPQRIQRGYFTQPAVQSYAFPQGEGALIQAHNPRHADSRHIIVCTHTFVSAPAYVLGVSEPACVVAFSPAMLVGNTHIVIETKTAAEQPPRPSRQEVQSGAGTILEMRPARRPPGERPQEELSEFEREYPW